MTNMKRKQNNDLTQESTISAPGLPGRRYRAMERIFFSDKNAHKRFQMALVNQIVRQRPTFQESGYIDGWLITNTSGIGDAAEGDVIAYDVNVYQAYGILERIEYVPVLN